MNNIVKRTAIIFLVLVMVASFTACKKNNPTDNESVEIE